MVSCCSTVTGFGGAMVGSAVSIENSDEIHMVVSISSAVINDKEL